jgi:hypothetical protein
MRKLIKFIDLKNQGIAANHLRAVERARAGASRASKVVPLQRA